MRIWRVRVSRRALIFSAGAAGLARALPLRRSHAEPATEEYRLAARTATVNLTGHGYPDTAVWAYEGTVPGPELRVRRGQPVRITVVNKLGEDTTVHWHGIRLPNAMDGVPSLTQKPIRPGESFVYEFTPPDAGTFWYHPHADTLQQLGRGLAGALIVEELEPVPGIDRDLLWLIEDWRLDDKGRIAGGFGSRMEAGMSGRIGNTVTINGRVPSSVLVKAGERVRLRIVNAALARIVGLRFDGHNPAVVAYDGQPCEAHSPLGRVRLTWLAVIGDDRRVVAIKPQPDDPGERGIDNPKSYSLPDFDQDGTWNAPVDRDGVADTPRHPGFHAAAEAARDPSLIVETPILDEPQQITVDARNRLEFLDDQCAGQTASKLLQRVGVRVIPERAGVGRGELVDEALAGPDRLLCQAGHAVHRVRQANAVPVDGCVLAELVDHRDPHRLAPTNPQFRAGHGALIGPHSGVRVSVAGQVYGRRLRGEPIFLSCRFRVAAAQGQCPRQPCCTRA